MLLVSEFLLGDERNFPQVVEVADRIGPHARRIEAFAVEFGFPVATADLPLEAFELQGGKFIACHAFDALLPKIAVFHHGRGIF